MEAGDSARVVVEPEVVVERGEGKMSDYAELEKFPKNMLERQVFDFLQSGKVGRALEPYLEIWQSTKPPGGDGTDAAEFYDFIKGYLTSMPEEPQGMQQAGPPTPSIGPRAPAFGGFDWGKDLFFQKKK